MTSIRSRFDQKGFKTFSNVEQLLFKACRGQCLKDELDQVCTGFYDDFNKDLVAELSTFHELYQSTVGDVVPSVDTIKTALKTVCRLFQLLLILPCSPECNLREIIQCPPSSAISPEEHDVTSKVKSSYDPALPPFCFNVLYFVA